MVTELKRLWWAVPIVLATLLTASWGLGRSLASTVRSEAAEAAGVPIERVELTDGLNVHLTGFATPDERDEAIAAVSALDSPWSVGASLADPGAGDDPSVFIRTTPTGRPPTVTVTVTAGRLVVEGTVGTQAAHDAVVAAVVDLIGPDAFDDLLVIDSDDMAAEGGTLTIGGDPVAEDLHPLWTARLTSATDELGMELVDELGVNSLEADLNDLFDARPIEFDPTSARISDASLPTLDAAAGLIAATPDIRLAIVGHTDSDGDADRNLRLSQERAEAVMAYLVEQRQIDPGRLVAEGRGETELEVEPELTPDDKQRNRRIEWEVVG